MMSRLTNYILNPETLMYEMRENRSYGFLKFLSVLVGSLLLFIIYLCIYTYVFGFDLPKTVILKRQHAVLQARIERMNARLDRNENVLATLALRDNNIYRSIFGMNDIPPEVRNAGFGGVDRYHYLNALDSGNPLRKAAFRIDILTKKAYIQSKSFDDVEQMARQAGDMASCIPAIMPVSPDASRFHFTSAFGYRTDPFTGGIRYHAGDDFGCDKGNPIYATGDGEVAEVRYEFFGYGLSVLIDHGFGYKTRYAHMGRIDVVEGMKVKRGECIGLSGNSGRSTGPHVHYEVIYKDNPVNPAGFFDLEITPAEYAELVRSARKDIER